MAGTLTTENQNSSSPNTLTESRFTAGRTPRATRAVIHCGNDGSRLLGLSAAKRINAVMLTCGTYDAAGEFAYRVGLPGKSGVGGGIVAIVPGRCAVRVWSPGLDARGNSVAGVAALDRFTTLTGWSVF